MGRSSRVLPQWRLSVELCRRSRGIASLVAFQYQTPGAPGRRRLALSLARAGTKRFQLDYRPDECRAVGSEEKPVARGQRPETSERFSRRRRDYDVKRSLTPFNPQRT